MKKKWTLKNKIYNSNNSIDYYTKPTELIKLTVDDYITRLFTKNKIQSIATGYINAQYWILLKNSNGNIGCETISKTYVPTGQKPKRVTDIIEQAEAKVNQRKEEIFSQHYPTLYKAIKSDTTISDIKLKAPFINCDICKRKIRENTRKHIQHKCNTKLVKLISCKRCSKFKCEDCGNLWEVY
jgi:hypothetical protein